MFPTDIEVKARNPETGRYIKVPLHRIRVTKEIKALSRKSNGPGNVIILSYRSLPDGNHYTDYRLIINIDDNDTITHIQMYYFKRQI